MVIRETNKGMKMIKNNVIMVERFSEGYGLSYYHPLTGSAKCHMVRYFKGGDDELELLEQTYNEALIQASCYRDCGMERVEIAYAQNVPKNLIEFYDFELILSETQFREKSLTL